MPKVNVYLPDDLAEAVRVSGIPVSAVCQRALEEAVRRVTAIRAAAIGELGDEGLASRLPHFTARARSVLELAAEYSQADGSPTIHTGHLLRAILDEGSNMALLILGAMEVDRGLLARDLASKAGGTEPGAGENGLHLSDPAANALELAVTESTGLGHNYVGCEHLLLGLAVEPDGVAGQVLRGRSVEPRATRRAIAAAIAGFAAAAPAPATPAPATSAPATPTAAGVAEALRPLLERIERLEAHSGLTS